MADDLQAALLRGHQREGLDTEGGHDLAGDPVDDVLHADGFGEHGGQVQQVVELPCSAWRGRRRGELRIRGVLGRGCGGRSDTDADAGGIRMELEGQPPIRRAPGGEGRGPAAEHRGSVTVFEDRVIQPGQRL